MSHGDGVMANTTNDQYTSARVTSLEEAVEKLEKKRLSACADLGESLYEVTKDSPTLRLGREALYGRIAEIDTQKASTEQRLKIARYDEDAQRRKEAALAQVYICPRCGTEVPADDLFCTGCGMPIAEIKATLHVEDGVADTKPVGFCRHCGAPLEEGDLFCSNCGHRVESQAVAEETTAAPAEEPSKLETVESPATDASTPVPEAALAPSVEAEQEEASPTAEVTSAKEVAAGPSPKPEPDDQPSFQQQDPFEEQPTMLLPVIRPEEQPSPQPAPAAPTQPYRFCPSCGSKVEPTYKFCLHCGCKLR